MSTKKPALFLILFLLLFGCTNKSEQAADAASDFKLQDLGGKTVKLSEFKGKPVLLDFWATWCPPCRASIPEIEKLHKSYSSKGLVVLAISLDQGGWDSVKDFVTESGITYTVLKGTDDVASKYHVRTIPMLVIVDKEGKIYKRYLGLGDDDQLDKDVKSVL
ncbi:MAG TPA: TlpA disulfide reductase family protein [Nitrospirota bacterium]|nr:TlpA disulfide reductase family protein [Nitrospirota bacterium]